MNKTKLTCTVSIPLELKSAFIGKGGRHVRDLEARTGCRFCVAQDRECLNGMISIRIHGSTNLHIQMAKEAISVLKLHKRRSTTSTSRPSFCMPLPVRPCCTVCQVPLLLTLFLRAPVCSYCTMRTSSGLESKEERRGHRGWYTGWAGVSPKTEPILVVSVAHAQGDQDL
jgi:hypothetical protein